MQEAKDPTSAEAELSAGAAENEKEPGTGVQMGTAGSETEVMLPSSGENGTTHTGAGKVTNNDQSLLACPVWPTYDPHSERMSENGEGQVPIIDGDGTGLHNEDGNAIYEESGWHVLRDQNGMVLWDSNGQMCIEEVDEDLLVIQTKSAHKQVPTTAVQIDSLVEQNQQLQTELGWAQFTHQTDVKHAQELLSQKEVQSQANHRAMTAELEKRKVAFTEE